MPVRRGLALYGTGVAAAGMLLFIVVLSGLGANGVRDDQDRALATMADTAVAAVAAPGLAPRGETESSLRVVARKWANASANGVVVAGQSTAFPANQIAG